jgi:hypothetical protein
LVTGFTTAAILMHAAPLLANRSGDYPDGLLLPPEALRPIRPDWRVVAALLLLCLVPRVFMACYEDELVSDATFYFQVADHLKAGDLQAAFYNLHLNVFPIVLVALRTVGLDYETAGEWWGVLMGALTVLPLYGLVRRQFDERVARAGCFLYAFHPPLAQWSREIVREPTFWFCFTLTLYLAWRAVIEVRWRTFLLAGAALSLAVYVRSEAWLLLICVSWWWFCRWLALPAARLRLSWCAICGLAVLPLSVMTINLTWLHDYPEWELGRFRHFGVVSKWLMAPGDSAMLSPSAATTNDSAAGPVVRQASIIPGLPWISTAIRNPSFGLPAAVARFSQRVLLRKYLTRLIKAFDPLFGLFFLVGLAVARPAARRRQQIGYLALNLTLMLGIWTYLVRSQEINSRYFFPIVVTSVPYAAIGLLWLMEHLHRIVPMRGVSTPDRVNRGGSLASLGLAAIVVVACFACLLTDRLHARRDQSALGRWIQAEWGPHQSIVGSSWAALFAYHSRADYSIAAIENNPDSFRQLVEARQPRIAVFWTGAAPSTFDEANSMLSLAMSRLNYRPVPPDELPRDCRQARVFLSRDAQQQLTRARPRDALPRH